jgi:DNA-binding response OmpR family regulator
MSSKKILIVEDDADLRLGCHLMLKAQGYETFLAVDGLSAISEAVKQRPDLILLDLGLPAGDGFVVLDRIRSNMHLSLTPVIVVSARNVHFNEEKALKAGAKAYVQKPWNDTDLLTIIGEQLGEPYMSASMAKFVADSPRG